MTLPQDSTVHVDILDQIQFRLGDGDVTAQLAEPAKKIAVYLFVFHEKIHRPETIAAQTDLTLPQIHRALIEIKSVFGDCIHVDQNVIYIQPETVVQTDVGRLTALLKQYIHAPHDDKPQAVLQQVLDLYSPRPHPTWSEPWVVTLHREVRRRYELALHQALAEARQNEDTQKVLQYALLLTKSNPRDEVAHRLVIQQYLAQGRYDEAQAQYEACVTAVGIPAPETKALAVWQRLMPVRPSAAVPIHLHLLGDWRCELDGEPISIPQTAVRQLLTYLVLHAEQAHSRMRLASFIFPRQSEEQGRRSLSRALWDLNQALAPHQLVYTQNRTLRLQYQGKLWCDVLAFRQRTPSSLGKPASPRPRTERAATLRREAVNLYTADLWLGDYEDWLLEQQRLLRNQYHRALEWLIDHEKEHGRYEQAIEYAQTLLRHAPLRERIHQELIRLYAVTGQPARAVSQYKRCRHILAQELDTQPSPQTEHIYASVRRRTPSAISLTAVDTLHDARLPLVGRYDAHQQLLQMLKKSWQSVHHHSPVYVVCGRAGIGKSHLMAQLARDAEWSGGQVMWGQAERHKTGDARPLLVDVLAEHFTPLRWEQMRPFLDRVWLQALRSYLTGLDFVTTDLAAAPPLAPVESAERMEQAVLEWLFAWSKIEPLLIILEDVHLADSETLQLLMRLARQEHTARLLIVATYRIEEARILPSGAQIEALSELRPPLKLEPLTMEECAQLIAHVLHIEQPVTALVRRLYQLTEGNPLFMLEMLRMLHEEGALVQDETGAWSLIETRPEPILSHSSVMQTIIMRRFALLPDHLRRLIWDAAVVGVAVTFTQLVALSGLPVHQLLDYIRLLIELRFLDETDTHYVFVHAKIRETIYERIPTAEKQQRHARFADWLADREPTKMEVIGLHYKRAQQWREAVDYLLAAAGKAQHQHAFRSAVRLYKQVRAVMTAEGENELEKRAEVLLSLCTLYHYLSEGGDEAAVLDALHELITDHDLPRFVHIQYYLGRAEFLLEAKQNAPEAEHCLQTALRLGMREEDDLLIAKIYRRLGDTWNQMGDYEQAREAFLQALSFFPMEEAGERLTTILSLRFANTLTGYEAENEELTRLTHATRRHVENPSVICRYYNMNSAAHLNAYDRRISLDYTMKGKRLAQQTGLKRQTVVYSINAGFYALFLPDYTAVYENLSDSIDRCRVNGYRSYLIWATSSLAQLCLHTGRHERLEALWTQVEALAETATPHAARFCGTAMRKQRAEYALDQGRFSEAQERFEALVDAYDFAERLEEYEFYIQFGLGRAVLEQGEYERAHYHLSCALDLYAGDPHHETWTKSYLALALDGMGQSTIARELMHTAVAQIDELPSTAMLQCVPYNQWRLLREDDPRQAEEALKKAYGLLTKHRDTLPHRDWYRPFVRKVSVNRAIETAYRAHDKGRRIIVQLPALSAPGRGPVSEEKLVTVNWTATHPDDETYTGRERRHQVIRRLITEATEQGATPAISDLAQVLEVSNRTVRRDLRSLRKAGYTLHTRGQR